jgi:hypothetical protein
MPNPAQVFQEIQRVLVPGGWSGFLTPGKMQVHDFMSQARKEVLAACNRENEFRGFYDSDMMRMWGTPEALKARLVDANFDVVEAVSFTSSLDMQRGAQVDETVRAFRSQSSPLHLLTFMRSLSLPLCSTTLEWRKCTRQPLRRNKQSNFAKKSALPIMQSGLHQTTPRSWQTPT